MVEEKSPEYPIDLIRENHSIPFEVFMSFKGQRILNIDLNFLE